MSLLKFVPFVQLRTSPLCNQRNFSILVVMNGQMNFFINFYVVDCLKTRLV